ncbi:MAG TPA: cation transporter [Burkholderiales bacterium]|nr:cation transporter [Burkholderiales bacterium]
MSAACRPPSPDADFRRVLWWALAINLAMFLIEVFSGLHARSTSLLADAVDFFGDATNYAISLLVLPMGLIWRARAAYFKGLTMLLYGIAILVYVGYSVVQSVLPNPHTMGIVGALAFLSNLAVAFLLYRFRRGDSNMRSVWLCTRNDVLGNLAVICAALGVFGTQSGWPDHGVAVVMALLALTSAVSVLRQSRAEMRGEAPPADEHFGHGH